MSRNIYERGVDDSGFARIRSKGDMALFGGHTTHMMKKRLEIAEHRPLADFLPTVTITAKNLATEITNFNVIKEDLLGEDPITVEHVQNNQEIRSLLLKRGIRPEALAPEEFDKKNLSERDICAKFIMPPLVDVLMALCDALESRLKERAGVQGRLAGAVVKQVAR